MTLGALAAPLCAVRLSHECLLPLGRVFPPAVSAFPLQRHTICRSLDRPTLLLPPPHVTTERTHARTSNLRPPRPSPPKKEPRGTDRCDDLLSPSALAHLHTRVVLAGLVSPALPVFAPTRADARRPGASPSLVVTPSSGNNLCAIPGPNCSAARPPLGSVLLLDPCVARWPCYVHKFPAKERFAPPCSPPACLPLPLPADG